MAAIAQVLPNQANSKRSTGSGTPDGKDLSSSLARAERPGPPNPPDAPDLSYWSGLSDYLVSDNRVRPHLPLCPHRGRGGYPRSGWWVRARPAKLKIGFVLQKTRFRNKRPQTCFVSRDMSCYARKEK
jgi:hypothetical protein